MGDGKSVMETMMREVLKGCDMERITPKLSLIKLKKIHLLLLVTYLKSFLT